MVARRDQGGAAFIDLADRDGKIQLHAKKDVLGDESFDRLVSLDIGDLIGVDGTAFKTRRGQLSLLVTRLEAAREVAQGHAQGALRPRGRRDPLPAARARPDRERGGARALHPAQQGRQRDPALARRARLPRGRDADPPAALRRRAVAALHDPPQRARPRLLPAHRRRAVPEAADRGRARARLRDRQGLPQRGHLAQAQPRVHDARVVRGVRGLQRHRERARGAGLVRGRGRGLRRPDRLLPPVEADHAARRHQGRDRHRHLRRRGAAGRGHLGQAGGRPALEARGAGPSEPDLRSWTTRRSSRRSRRTTAPRKASWSASRRSRAGWSTPTPSPS